ncbi:MAG: exodeoxyribonuclease VII small subunit [Candidatus Omnitrophica bacterium]|nr:exodeoxyribonuclease VII small subunit [Candidatus Omnitrophota bacterium]MDE2008788.1 exodeoxyribonuclease VII small subunit [Candidatus Omnitrophota bacterium]MDE2213649.1 exodeoxyribonuclease VII small subunit [Candidatus Omnitrophota bacterium]MDE2230450.1 exodeoxyribonuclease VII small subunit [Candidatus Omnitrophota bacterium]
MAEAKYSKAVQRLDEIIGQIESDEIDVDELSLRVKEAVGLIKLCKAKIDKAEMEIKQVVDDFAKEAKESLANE